MGEPGGVGKGLVQGGAAGLLRGGAGGVDPVDLVDEVNHVGQGSLES